MTYMYTFIIIILSLIAVNYILDYLYYLIVKTSWVEDFDNYPKHHKNSNVIFFVKNQSIKKFADSEEIKWPDYNSIPKHMHKYCYQYNFAKYTELTYTPTGIYPKSIMIGK